VDLQTAAWLDQADAYNADRIRRYGWAIQYVAGDMCSAPRCDCAKTGNPAFAYTVGLFGLSHPELLILGADPATAMGVLNNLGHRIRAGGDVIPGHLITFREWPHRIIAEESPNPGEIVYAANRYYQRPRDQSVPVLQLTYDDRQGRFPWDEGYSAPQLQPRPGEFRA
jgi:Domain of unknown function (DUF4262)